LEEAKKRDHRRLGKELDLFTISEEVGPGLILWHPRLSIIRNEIENFWKKEHQKRGYQYVYSPHLGKKSLWEKSGHWQFYRDLIYSPMNIEGTEYLVKPMNCPFHLQIYKSKPRSYKELPIRYCELGTVYRYEPIGTLHGLTRVRGFTQDDAHIFCTPEQLEKEILEVLNLAIFMLQSFDFNDFQVDLSVRDPKNKEKYLGSDRIWKKAETALETALRKKQLKYHRAEGEAVFYGPKIDIKLVDSAGRTWQGPTIQVDFNFPEKFNLEYTGPDGKTHRPVMIHRTVLGSMERFVGTLIEHYAGAFPVWLSPIQTMVIPIAEKHNQYAQGIAKFLKENNIRAESDERNETTSAKIRDAELQKIPYILVVGDREVGKKTVNVRARGERVLGEMSLEAFLKKVTSDIAKKE
jgi:threonyl-tRNA synthetase